MRQPKIIITTSLVLLLFYAIAGAIGIGLPNAIKKKTTELDNKIKDQKASAASTTPAVNPPPVTPTTIDEKVDALMAQMTLDEKIGQMALVDSMALYLREDDTKNYFLGGVLSGGESDPSNNEPVTWANLYDLFQTYALQTRLAIPIIYGIDAVHGNSNIVGAVIFPHSIGLGCTGDKALVPGLIGPTLRALP